MLIIETGDTITGANSYVTIDEADNYAPSHMSGAAWSAKTTPAKEAILATATRTIDAGVRWKGDRRAWDQPLEWPRENVIVHSGQGRDEVPMDLVPQQVKTAVLEYAMLLAAGGDRTADQDSDGIASVSLGKGALSVTFDPSTKRPPLGTLVPSLLRQLIDGTALGKKGMVPVTRE